MFADLRTANYTLYGTATSSAKLFARDQHIRNCNFTLTIGIGPQKKRLPVLGITSLCPWERHLMQISLQALCVVWKTAQMFVLQRHIRRKKIKNQIKKQAVMVLPVSPKVGLGNNCSMLNVYGVVPGVRRINRTNQNLRNGVPLGSVLAILHFNIYTKTL